MGREAASGTLDRNEQVRKRERNPALPAGGAEIKRKRRSYGKKAGEKEEPVQQNEGPEGKNDRIRAIGGCGRKMGRRRILRDQ